MSNTGSGREKTHACGCRNGSLTTEYDPHTEMLTFQEKNSWEQHAVQPEWRLPGACLLSAGKPNSLRHQGGCLLSPQETFSLWGFQRPLLPQKRQCACLQSRVAQPQLLIRATWGACKNSNIKSTPRPVPSGLAGGLGSGVLKAPQVTIMHSHRWEQHDVRS